MMKSVLDKLFKRERDWTKLPWKERQKYKPPVRGRTAGRVFRDEKGNVLGPNNREARRRLAARALERTRKQRIREANKAEAERQRPWAWERSILSRWKKADPWLAHLARNRKVGA